MNIPPPSGYDIPENTADSANMPPAIDESESSDEDADDSEKQSSYPDPTNAGTQGLPYFTPPTKPRKILAAKAVRNGRKRGAGPL